MVIRTGAVQQATEKRLSRLLEPDEFCKLLLSRRRLVRFDKKSTTACRLIDESTGEVFDVEEAELDKYIEKEAELVKREHARGSHLPPCSRSI